AGPVPVDPLLMQLSSPLDLKYWEVAAMERYRRQPAAIPAPVQVPAVAPAPVTPPVPAPVIPTPIVSVPRPQGGVPAPVAVTPPAAQPVTPPVSLEPVISRPQAPPAGPVVSQPQPQAPLVRNLPAQPPLAPAFPDFMAPLGGVGMPQTELEERPASSDDEPRSNIQPATKKQAE
ncbi:MAG: hypothetical protein HQL11_03425, partial [Candidatus Omnitrophica bacterium]|nr:hypothetical protein [Candidatus Omnitrophota bacterium]